MEGQGLRVSDLGFRIESFGDKSVEEEKALDNEETENKRGFGKFFKKLRIQ